MLLAPLLRVRWPVQESVNIVRSWLFSRKMCASATPAKMMRMSDKSASEKDRERDRLIWVDCEMTGLDVETCHLLEVACIITDDQLHIVAKGPNIIIHQADKILDEMNEWCVKQHGQSGLTQKVRESKTSLLDAENQLLEFVRKYTPLGTCPLAGNSVHADKIFLMRYMPRFVEHLHYRIVDVSTVKELCRRWYPDEYHLSPPKQGTHRALDDIEESINELHFYRRVIFKQANKY